MCEGLVGFPPRLVNNPLRKIVGHTRQILHVTIYLITLQLFYIIIFKHTTRFIGGVLEGKHRAMLPLVSWPRITELLKPEVLVQQSYNTGTVGGGIHHSRWFVALH